ncbi:crotonobetainyl-CoA--carnitine CoA-transferase [Candidatus Woesebacteria bacterium RIFCSPLOWO2_01_FULL_39_23]|nr:MAG: crotonobetainyl-CoA--carnitine CoA-transferase [Candidatus Woesebacteria bacterium RIFCSPLOWO2_01_FULL_39_23]
MKTEKHDAIVLSSSDEKEILKNFIQHFKNAPLPDDEMLSNLGLFLSSKSLSRILFFYEIYKKIIHSHGIIAEFGVRWGQTLSIMSVLRGIFEPFNRHRKIVGFDTFEGFKGMSEKDGKRCQCGNGSFSVSQGYENYLENILDIQEKLNPMAHIKRYELVKGDAVETVPAYLKKHPETIISLSIFDFDIYAPTKAALEAIKPHLCKGSILVFDELCDDIFPGETVALNETLGLNNVRVQRFPMTSRISYLVIE